MELADGQGSKFYTFATLEVGQMTHSEMLSDFIDYIFTF